jgi:hypothetical protein
MRRRTKFALAVTMAALVLLTPLAVSWLVRTSYEMPDRPDDVDGDGLPDERERELGTDPGVRDTDGDGIDDGPEHDMYASSKMKVYTPTPPLVLGDGPDGDLDGDGLANILDPDSDDDGLLDGEELEAGTSPLHFDTDEDGVTDPEDPEPLSDRDEDGDGLADDWEAFYGVSDPSADEDGDGLVNLLEYREGMSPVLSFGLDEGFTVDLSEWTDGKTIESMGDIYEPFREASGSLDLRRPLFQVDPTTPARYWRLMDVPTWDGWGWQHPLPRTGDVVVPGDPDDIGDWPAYVYTVSMAGPWKGPLPAPLHSQVLVGVEHGVVRETFGTFTAGSWVQGYSVTSPQLLLGEYLEGGYGTNTRDLPPYDIPPVSESDVPFDAEATSSLGIAVEARDHLWERVAYSNAQGLWRISSLEQLEREGLGNSLDFASALTIICRAEGVPARVAVGFAPGIITGGHRIVRVGDLHAWTEVFDGELWIPVEATPRGSLEGLGMGVAGADPGVYMDMTVDDNGTNWVPAAGGALTSGSGGIELPDGDEDTDGDGVPDDLDDDDDDDGLTDAEEWELGTNPIDADTDHDLLPDGAEIENGTSPVNGDSDGDGVTDGVEVILLGTDPLDRDSDGAGSCDIQELEHNTDPLDPEDDYIALDADCDGITDAEEARLGTDPNSWDSDLDGLSDGLELELGSDPVNWDTDGDMVPDGEELDRRTDPLVRDTDGDGLDDGEELGYDPTYLAHPTDPRLSDTDGDGIDDGREVALSMRPDHVDVDGDGLTDDREMDLRTDPYERDSDGDGVDDWEEAQLAGFEDDVDTARDGLVPIYIALVVLSAAFALRYRPFDKRIVPDVIDRISELERWLATLKEAPDDEVRRAIYKAYEGLCSILSDYGYLERKEGWTAREFEEAAFEALPWVPDGLLKELTRLFEEARFSDHELPADYVERARTCLVGVREALEEVVGKPRDAVAVEAAA